MKTFCKTIFILLSFLFISSAFAVCKSDFVLSIIHDSSGIFLLKGEVK